MTSESYHILLTPLLDTVVPEVSPFPMAPYPWLNERGNIIRNWIEEHLVRELETLFGETAVAVAPKLHEFFENFFECGLWRIDEDKRHLHSAPPDYLYIEAWQFVVNQRIVLQNGNVLHFAWKNILQRQEHESFNQAPKIRLARTKPEIQSGEMTIWMEQIYSDQSQTELFKSDWQQLQKNIPGEWESVLMHKVRTSRASGMSFLERVFKQFVFQAPSDFFVCRNTREFLGAGLDVFITQNWLNLDTLRGSTDKKLHLIEEAQAFRQLALGVIDTIAQCEETVLTRRSRTPEIAAGGYLISLKHIPRKFYKSIAANTQQREEWIKVIGIDRIKGYSKPLTSAFLKKHPHLMCDTRFFSESLVKDLLAACESIIDRPDGLLIRGENETALRWLKEDQKEQVHCIYIDPPYNANQPKFTARLNYRNVYSPVAWHRMIRDRIAEATALLAPQKTLFCSIGKEQLFPLLKQIQTAPESLAFIDLFSWVKTNSPSGLARKSKKMVEYLLVFEKDPGSKRYQSVQRKVRSANPLLNQSNAVSELTFPAGTPAKIENSEISPGEYGTAKYAITLTTPLLVKDGVLQQPATLSGRFKWSQQYFENQLAQGVRVEFLTKKLVPVYRKPEYGRDTPSNLINAKVNVGTYEDATRELQHQFGSVGDFAHPKPVSLIRYLIDFNLEKDETVLDFYAGSGTTAQAVMELNATDGGTRRFILAERGHSFDRLIVPRIQKTAFSNKWHKGQPTGNGQAQCVRYIHFQS
ncbi:MAG: site-specific DNA-methyltransferase [Cryomorphaceae bacterium]|nr:MAG: site-specific DNA-methyltransferase [Cryomorphaceae bacterium]